MMTTYDLMHSDTAERIGYVDMTYADYAEYVRSNTPEGHMRLGSLPHEMYTLDEEYQGLHEDTRVYITE